MTATAPGGVPMVRHSASWAADTSLVLMTDAERCAIAFANGVLAEMANGMFHSQPQIAETYREQAGILRSLLDRLCQ
jgi:hypothetical protein